MTPPTIELGGLRTSRDLYLFVAELARHATGEVRGLEEYLRALWQLGSANRASAEFTLADFGHLLRDAFSSSAPEFDPAWGALADAGIEHASPYQEWEQRIFSQIRDLREMEAAGIFADEWRYFGVPAPRGQYWYNFDALTYLECATTGTFGGWQPGDDTGRRSTREPQETGVRPILDIPSVSWSDFSKFLKLGQIYE